MKNRITNVCRNIPQNILISTVENFEKRLRLCLQENGAPHLVILSTAKDIFELILVGRINLVLTFKPHNSENTQKNNFIIVFWKALEICYKNM